MRITITVILQCLYLVLCDVKFLDLSSQSGRVSWTLENINKSIVIPAKVPGGVYSDLQRAGVIGDILAGFNDVLTRWVARDTWTYTGVFTLKPEDLEISETLHLVFHGVDTVSFIHLNGNPIGTTDNMFVRYVFDVKGTLKKGSNILRVEFVSPVLTAELRSNESLVLPQCVPPEYHGECHANQLRKMQASFSWDWGPAFPSVGIWKHIFLESYNGAIIRSVTTHISKKFSHWYVKIVSYLESSSKVMRLQGTISATLTIRNQIVKISDDVKTVTRNDGTVEVQLTITVSENKVDVWWPNGYGDQTLYNLDVIFLAEKQDDVSTKSIKIGFRTIELIEHDASTIFGDTPPGEGLTFYFKVNGYPIFMKGTNWIPANILPENGTDPATVDHLLRSAKAAHMNMMRVWGGGVYESDYFYQKCDELGILIWQDFLFACSMYPASSHFLNNVKAEVEQNVLRLQHHPSIAVWAGNNENEVALRGNWYGTQTQFAKYKTDYIRLYVESIKPIIEYLDPNRRYLISSPSNGIQSEKEGYVAQNPYDSRFGDTHYYNYFADNWDPNIYPPTRFASEYGFQSLPSISTMSTATTNSVDFNVNSEYSKHRQHAPLGYQYIEQQINNHLKINKNDHHYFEKFIYYSQIVQAMSMKVETEYYRQSQATWYTMGALYWQLNDVWQAPSWSGIEYGGKWKMLHYFAKTFFAPVLISPRLLKSQRVDVYLINDRFVPITNALICLDYFHWNSTNPYKTYLFDASVGSLSTKLQNITISLWQETDRASMFLRFSLKAEGVVGSPYNYVFPTSLINIKGLKEPKIEITVKKNKQQCPSEHQYTIHIYTDTIVLFLWLEVDIKGHFEDNGFIMSEPNTTVTFITEHELDVNELERLIDYKYYTV